MDFNFHQRCGVRGERLRNGYQLVRDPSLPVPRILARNQISQSDLPHRSFLAGGAEIFAGEWRMETSLWFEHSPGGWVTNNARITIDSECGHGRIVVAVDSIFTHLIHKDDILY